MLLHQYETPIRGRWSWILSAALVAAVAGSCSTGDSKPPPIAEPTGDSGPGKDAEAGHDAAGGKEGGKGGSSGKDGGDAGETGGADAGDANDESDVVEEPSAACSNNVKDGTETDIDCGGSCPKKCGTGKGCSKSPDCEDLNCVDKKCVAATCTDTIQNGLETDVDCGGTPCDKCADNKKCTAGPNCKSGVCLTGVCQVPTCVDQTKNGTESDIDCGGTCSHKCPTGQKCGVADDCTSKLCDQGTCKCPAKMITAPSPGGGSYCIDVTEVPYNDYIAFVNANPTNQPAYCTWNTTYVPADHWPPSNVWKPVTDIDWCDAFAFCIWAGKRLCGDSAGGAAPIDGFADEVKSQWFNACSAQGVNEYPYGHTYGKKVCNGVDFPDGDALPPGTYVVRNGNGDPGTSGCIGGLPGLYDMSGNVGEWEDSCSAQVGENDNCRLRGGSYESTETELLCNADKLASRSAHGPTIGFRCCL